MNTISIKFSIVAHFIFIIFVYWGVLFMVILHCTVHCVHFILHTMNDHYGEIHLVVGRSKRVESKM